MQRMGHEHILSRSDGEHSVVLLQKAAQLAQVKTVPQESSVGECHSNGESECAVREGVMRDRKG